MKVLYIIGKGRSGTTLLDELLGQFDGFVSTGELRFIWEWGMVAGYPCSCGRHVTACPLWSGVLDRLGSATRAPSRSAELTSRALSWARVPLLLAGDGVARSSRAIREYAAVMSRMYRAIAEETGARVIVDSTKWPAHPGMLGLVDGIAPFTLHVVRDPRGVAFSYLREKPTAEDQPDMPRFPATHSAMSWLARNLVAEVALRRVDGRTQRLRYEDFVESPRASLRWIARFLGEEVDGDPFVDDRRAYIAGTHLVGGNPDRFARGVVDIRSDDEWRTSLRGRDERIVSSLTAPLLGHYGYRTGRHPVSRP